MPIDEEAKYNSAEKIAHVLCELVGYKDRETKEIWDFIFEYAHWVVDLACEDERSPPHVPKSAKSDQPMSVEGFAVDGEKVTGTAQGNTVTSPYKESEAMLKWQCAPEQPDECRNDFEKWATYNYMSTYKDHQGNFGQGVQICWEAFQAGWKSRPMREIVAIPADNWCEEDSSVLWWKFPIEEAPWCGTPLDGEFCDLYYTHFTRISIPKDPTHIEGDKP